MNAFDDHILEFFNRLSQRSYAFDQFVVQLDNELLKGGVVVGLIWWVWFLDEEADAPRRRSILLASLATSVVAVVVARGLAHLLPFRERPMYALGSEFTAPSGDNDLGLSEWSSFPSDHAVLFFALATGLWFARRSFGIFAYAYAAIVICLPRVYLGLHWPTDILAGAALGVGIGWLGARTRVAQSIGAPLFAWQERHPGPFFAAMFVVWFEIAGAGENARDIASQIVDALLSLLASR